MMPLAVGKLTAINGKPVDSIKFADERAKDSADRQLRLSWASELPPATRSIAGQWPDAHPAQADGVDRHDVARHVFAD
jgi:putative ABC transport system permease protein